MFAPRSVRGFEVRVKVYIGQLVAKWDQLCATVNEDQVGRIGSCEFKSRDGRVWIDCMSCELLRTRHYYDTQVH